MGWLDAAGELGSMPVCTTIVSLLITLVAALAIYIAHGVWAGRKAAAQVKATACSLKADDLSVQINQRAFGRSQNGAVFKGLWNGAPVTIKVTRQPKDAAHDEVYMRRYMMSHPNVAQLYAYRVDPVIQQFLDTEASFEDMMATSFVSGALWRRGSHGPVSLPAAIDSCTLSSPYHFVPSVPGALFHPPQGTVEVVQVYEDFDMSSLRDYIEVDNARPPLTPAAEEQRKVVVAKTLLEVARALAHMHAAGFVHGDLTSSNVFLKSVGPRDSRHFTAKIGDFSLGEGNFLAGNDKAYGGVSTISHVAPEGLKSVRATTTPALDIYAFGILMYEYYTGEEAYTGLSWQDVKAGKLEENLVPQFPGSCPQAFSFLAVQCWDASPAKRPTAQEVLRSLTVIEQQLRFKTLPSDLDAGFACLNSWRGLAAGLNTPFTMDKGNEPAN